MWFKSDLTNRLAVVFAFVVLSSAAQAETTWYVDDDNCPGPGSGTQADPFCSIQDAIDAATAGDLVLVAAGAYFENVVMKAQVDLEGAGASVTTIDAGGSGSAVIGADALIRGFTITNAAGINERAINCVNGSSPRIEDNVIAGNDAVGIVLFQSSATIIGNTIIGNPRTFADPILCSQSAPIIADNFIDGADPNGNLDAIHMTYINVSMTDSFRIEGNVIIGRVFLSDINSLNPLDNVIGNNLFLTGNGFSSAINIAFSPNAGKIVNNTLVGGSGIFLQGVDSFATITNNIIAFGNQGIEVTGSSSVLFTYNNVFGNQANYVGIPDQTGMNGNISSDPLFVDFPNGNYRLSPGSPCIDAADNTAVPKGIDTDLDGNPRFVDDPDTKDTGFGDPPIVDMGAYEFQPVLCPWDLDESGFVGASDLLDLLFNWGPCPGCAADFDGDDIVGASDLITLLFNWGPCP